MYSHVWLRWWKKCALFSRSVLTKLYMNPTKPSLIISQDKFSLPSAATGPSMSQWVTTEMGFFLMEDKSMHGIKNINQKIIYRVRSHVAQLHCLVLSWKKTWVWISPPTCKGKKKQHLWIHSFSFEFKFFFVSVIWVFIDFYAELSLEVGNRPPIDAFCLVWSSMKKMTENAQGLVFLSRIYRNKFAVAAMSSQSSSSLMTEIHDCLTANRKVMESSIISINCLTNSLRLI